MKKVVLAVVLAFTAFFMALTYINACTSVYASVYTNVLGNMTETPPEVPLDVIHAVWAAAKMVPSSLLIAFATCLVGYLSKTDPEKFRLDYFVYTMLISFVIGMATLTMKWDYGAIEQLLANGFVTWWIWKAARIIAKKLGWATQVSSTVTGPGPPGTA